VFSDSERAFSGAPESTCSYGDAFKMLQDLTCRMVKFWSRCDLERSLRLLCSPAGDLVQYFSQQWFLGFHNHMAFRVSDSSLLESQDSQHHNMACIIFLSLSTYIHMANLAADGTAV